MIKLWTDSFLLKRLDKEYKILNMIIKEYNMIPKDDKNWFRRKAKVKQLKEQYYNIRTMEDGWV